MTRNDWWGGVLPFGFGLRSRLTALGRARRWPAALQAAPVLGIAPVMLLLAGAPKTAQPPDLVLDLAHAGYTGQLVSLDDVGGAKETVLGLLKNLAADSGLPIDHAASLQDAMVSLHAPQVPWDRALAGLLHQQDARLLLRGGELIVVPAAEVHASGADADGGALGSRSFPFPSADTAALGAWVVRASLSTNGDVTVDQRWNSLTVKDVAWRLDALAPVLAGIAAKPLAPGLRGNRKVANVTSTPEEISVAFSDWQPPALEPVKYRYELMLYRVPLSLARELRVGPGGVTPWEVTARDVDADERESLRNLTSRPGVKLVTSPAMIQREGEPANIVSNGEAGADPRVATTTMEAHREGGHVELRWDVTLKDSAAHYAGHADAPVLLGFPLRNEPDMAGLALLTVYHWK